MPRMALRIAATSTLRRAPAAMRATAGSTTLRYCSRSSSSFRLRMTRTISSSAAIESLALCETKVPPLRPRRASTRPVASNSRSAFWMVGRPTPNITASSRSAGSDSPGWIRRSEMCRRICSATYSCARRGSKRTPVATSPPFVLTATGTLRRRPRDPVHEAAEEPLASLPHLRRETIRLLEQRVRVDSVAIELVSVGLDPALHDLGRHLGMKLQPKISADHVRLRRDVRLRDQLRARWKRERVEVPVEPGTFRHKVRVFGPHRQPADLGVVGAERLAAEHPRQELSSEAEPKHRNISLRRGAQQLRFPRYEGLGVVKGGELRAERRDEVVLAGIVGPVVQIDAMNVDFRLLLVEPFREISRRRGLFVLEDQDLELAGHATGLASSLASSSPAT